MEESLDAYNSIGKNLTPYPTPQGKVSKRQVIIDFYRRSHNKIKPGHIHQATGYSLNYIYKILSNYRTGKDYGHLHKVLKGSYHRVGCEVYLPAEVVDVLKRVAKGRVKDSDRWYVALNRNKALCFYDNVFSVRVYPKSGRAILLPKRPMSDGEVQRQFDLTLIVGGVHDEEVRSGIVRAVRKKSRHLVFPVGLPPETPPSRIDYLKPLGYEILINDGSHKGCVELVEHDSPLVVRSLCDAAKSFAESGDEFGKHFKTHMGVLTNIEDATRALKDVVIELKGAICGKTLEDTEAAPSTLDFGAVFTENGFGIISLK